jgi:AraC-like DNA-binding protein/ligand-binding sensor domain-containing protein
MDEYGPVRISDHKRLSVLKSGGRIYCSDTETLYCVDGDSLRPLVSVRGPAKDIITMGDSLWICRNDNSLYVFDKSSGSISEYRTGGLFNKTRDVDMLGKTLLFATGNGLTGVSEDGNLRTINVFPSDTEGYHIPVNRLQKDLQGGLWVTSFHDGVCRLDEGPECLYSPAPVITGISVNGEKLLPSPEGAIEKDVRYLDRIRLSGKVSELDISFSVVNLSSEGGNSFRYMLEGYEKNWHEQDNRTPATFQKLKRGRYCFRLCSANADGIWSDEEKRLYITVGARLEIAVLLAVLAACGLAAAVSRASNKRKKRIFKVSSSIEGLEYTFDCPGTGTLSPEAASFLKKVVRTIESNAEDGSYSSSKLASDLGMSRSSMYGQLSDIIGIGAGKLMSGIRLDMARHLLESGNCSIDEAAEKTGFNSRSYFSSCFKKRFGRTPKAFLPVLALLLLLGAPCSGQNPSARVFREIALPDYAAGGPVCSMCQDSDGFMWMTNGTKLFRYDGSRFTAAGFKGLHPPYPSVGRIVRDASGRLWALTDEGAWLYDTDNHQFTDILHFHKASVRGLADIGQGLLLVASSMGTRVCNIRDGVPVNDMFPRQDLRFKSASTLGRNAFLVGENGGLYRWNMDSDRLELLASAGKEAILARPVLDNLVWIRTEDGKETLYMINESGLGPVPGSMDPLYFSRDDDSDFLRFVDDNGGWWCATRDGKLYFSSPEKYPLSYLPDKNGNNLFESSVVSCIAAAEDGSIWMGRPGDGNILRYDPKTSSLHTYRCANAYETKSIIPLGREVLAGFYSGGLYIIDTVTGKAEPVSGLKCIRNILPWEKGTFLLTSNTDLYRFDRNTGTLTEIHPEGWTSAYMKQLFLDSAGCLWIASEKGLQMYSCEDGEFKPEARDVLPRIRRATDIIEDDNGIVWITTEYGLWSYDRRFNRLQEFTDPLRLFQNTVLYCIEKDGSGKLWISGSEGLFSMNPANGFVMKYTGEQKAICSQYVSGASAVCPDGRLLFAGVGGVTVVSADDDGEASFLPEPVPEAIRCGPDTLTLKDGTISIKEGKDSLKISFIIPDMASSGAYALAFNMDGGEGQIAGGVSAETAFRGLKAGTHILSYHTIRVSDGAGGKEKSLIIDVRRRNGPLFALLSILAAILTVAILLILRKKGKESDSVFLDKASAVIEECMHDKNLSVGDFATKMGMSKKNLYDKIGRYAKTTPSAFIRDKRILAAKKLLTATDMPVSEVGDRVGFASTSYFILVFRKNTGTTPFNYRQQARSRRK